MPIVHWPKAAFGLFRRIGVVVLIGGPAKSVVFAGLGIGL
jgi:hypothetical protein